MYGKSRMNMLVVGIVSAMGLQGILAETTAMETSKSVNHDYIEFEVVVKTNVETVWNVWSTAEGSSVIFRTTIPSNVELSVGGPFEHLFSADAPKGEQGSEGCKFLSYLPHKMLSFSWNAPPKFAHARGHLTWVVLRFEPVDQEHTKLTLSHLGWSERKAEFPDYAEEWDDVRDYFSKAWPIVLGRLVEKYEG